MSDKDHDLGSLVDAVWCAAYDLKQAVQRARQKHPELQLPDECLLREINDGLRMSGFCVVIDKNPLNTDCEKG